jgi:hypothetical protein
LLQLVVVVFFGIIKAQHRPVAGILTSIPARREFNPSVGVYAGVGVDDVIEEDVVE